MAKMSPINEAFLVFGFRIGAAKRNIYCSYLSPALVAKF
jgi:hypothetical protein